MFLEKATNCYAHCKHETRSGTYWCATFEHLYHDILLRRNITKVIKLLPLWHIMYTLGCFNKKTPTFVFFYISEKNDQIHIKTFY